VITISIVVIAVLVIGGVLLFDRSDDTGGSGGEIPQELRAVSDSNTLTEASGNKVTIVEFLDYQCPACAAYYQNVTREIETDYAGTITFVTRNFPLEMHALAQPAARAAEAAAKQGKYREMYHALYDNYEEWAVSEDGQQLSDDARRAATLFDRYATDIGLDLDRFHTDMAAPEVQDRIDTDLAAGEKAGVSSTPTIFVNGTKFEADGDQFTDVDRQLRDIIDEALG
jgi:protein-disulfide isomerase